MYFGWILYWLWWFWLLVFGWYWLFVELVVLVVVVGLWWVLGGLVGCVYDLQYVVYIMKQGDYL